MSKNWKEEHKTPLNKAIALSKNEETRKSIRKSIIEEVAKQRKSMLDEVKGELSSMREQGQQEEKRERR